MKKVLGCLVLGAWLLASSCNKPTECKATVRCVDSTGSPLRNMNVQLYAPVKHGTPPITVTADVQASGVTDDNGLVKFTFKLPAIFDIKATGTSNSKPLAGAGLIRLEAGSGTEQTVTLK